MDLLDVQQPVPVLVSLLEGLLHPAASMSRTGTTGDLLTEKGGRAAQERILFAPALTTAQSNA